MEEGGKPAYGRVLVKLSGEALMGSQPFGIDEKVVAAIADEIRDVHSLGVGIAVVVGGGNIIRGLPPATAGSTASPATTWGCWPP
jgi:uridylate kinase